MIELDVDPKTVWGFYSDHVGVSKSLLEIINNQRFNGIPRVPVFEIPRDIRMNGHIYLLADGNHRRNVAEYANILLPIALFDSKERINARKHRLAYFKQMNHPTLYERLIKMYLLSID